MARVSWGDMTELRLLGPIELRAADTLVDLGPVKRRAVVAALAVDATRPVTVADIVDRVWDESPPAHVRSAIYAHVAHIRRSLAQASALGDAPVHVHRRGRGYVLDIDPDRVDLHRFRRLVSEARDRPDSASRARWFRQALDLWRGTPLAGMSGSWAERIREGCIQQRALRLFRRAGHRPGIATALNSLGWYHSLMGDHRQALVYCEDALTRAQELGHRPAEAATWDSLGHAHRHLGHVKRAISCYRQAVDIYRELGDHYNMADSLIGLGGSQADFGDVPAAWRSLTQALAILEEFDHPDADRVRAELERLEHARPE